MSKLSVATLYAYNTVGNGTGGGLTTTIVVDGVTINAGGFVAPSASTASLWASALATAINASTTLVNGKKVTAVASGSQVLVAALVTTGNASWLSVTLGTSNGDPGNLNSAVGDWKYADVIDPWVPPTAKLSSNTEVAAAVAAGLLLARNGGL